MPVVAVVNRKGGSGKTTLATHLAAWFANGGHAAMLGDVDFQGSAQAWLKRRAGQEAVRGKPIVGWSADPRNVLRPPAGVTHVVLDTPGGLRGLDLAKVVMTADAILPFRVPFGVRPRLRGRLLRRTHGAAARGQRPLQGGRRRHAARCAHARRGRAAPVGRRHRPALHRRDPRDAGLRALRGAGAVAVRHAAVQGAVRPGPVETHLRMAGAGAQAGSGDRRRRGARAAGTAPAPRRPSPAPVPATRPPPVPRPAVVVQVPADVLEGPPRREGLATRLGSWLGLPPLRRLRHRNL